MPRRETFNTPHTVAVTHTMDQQMRDACDKAGIPMSELHRAAIELHLNTLNGKAQCTICRQPEGDDCKHFIARSDS